MTRPFCSNRPTRLDGQAGIAIGPILFIIAILAILAAAIAAGSGSFTAPTAGESAKTKAAGLISVGESLKIGMDRLTVSNGATPSGSTAFVLDPTSTSSQYDLFSPTGGGIAPPSAALAANVTSDSWHFMNASFPGLGDSDATNGVDYFAVLNVTGDVCNEINNRAGVSTAISATLAVNDVLGVATPADGALANPDKLPPQLSGKTLGCFGSTHSSVATYYFYQILYIQ